MRLNETLADRLEYELKEAQKKGTKREYSEKLHFFLYEATYWVGKEQTAEDVDVMDLWAAFRIILLQDLQAEIPQEEMWEPMMEFCRFASSFRMPLGNPKAGIKWIKRLMQVYQAKADEMNEEVADYSISSHREYLTAAARWRKIGELFDQALSPA